AVLLPGPELRRDKVEDGNSGAVEMFGEREIHVGEVDENGEVGALGEDCGFEAAVFAVDAGHVEQDFGDAHDGHVFGAHDGTEAEGFHAASAETEEFGAGNHALDGGDEGCSVVLAAGFSGGEKDAG